MTYTPRVTYRWADGTVHDGPPTAADYANLTPRVYGEMPQQQQPLTGDAFQQFPAQQFGFNPGMFVNDNSVYGNFLQSCYAAAAAERLDKADGGESPATPEALGVKDAVDACLAEAALATTPRPVEPELSPCERIRALAPKSPTPRPAGGDEQDDAQKEEFKGYPDLFGHLLGLYPQGALYAPGQGIQAPVLPMTARLPYDAPQSTFQTPYEAFLAGVQGGEMPAATPVDEPTTPAKEEPAVDVRPPVSPVKTPVASPAKTPVVASPAKTPVAVSPAKTPVAVPVSPKVGSPSKAAEAAAAEAAALKAKEAEEAEKKRKEEEEALAAAAKKKAAAEAEAAAAAAARKKAAEAAAEAKRQAEAEARQKREREEAEEKARKEREEAERKRKKRWWVCCK